MLTYADVCVQVVMNQRLVDYAMGIPELVASTRAMAPVSPPPQPVLYQTYADVC
jgi:hypothetical protein